MFDAILYRPIFNALVFLYNTVAFQDLGIAIILLTILVRILLFPLFHKSTHQQMMMQKLQPKMKQIQDDHKHDKEKQAAALMGLYKEHNLNPFSWILLFIVQIPILFALFKVFRMGFSPENFGRLYSFVAVPDIANHFFLNILDLTQSSIPVVILAAVFQYIQGKLTVPPNSGNMARQMKAMLWIGPIITIVFLWNWPSAIGLYWMTTTLFSIGQQKIIMRSMQNNDRLSTTTKTT